MFSSLSGLADNAAEAAQAVRANCSPRQLELEELERWATGTQYDGRPDWFSDDCPLWDRAPCVVDPIFSTAIRSTVDLVFGESLFPTLTSNPGENDADAGGLDEEASRRVDRALSELLDRVRFRAVSRQALEHAQQSKSVAVIAGSRKGKPFLELVRSAWCEPTIDAQGDILALEIRYAYVSWEKQVDGKWKLRPLIYRRVIDQSRDVTFRPVVADPSGREPPPSAWVEDSDRSINHGLGFCPVHWYAHMRECSTVADYDGRAVHSLLLDEKRALDFSLSTRHRAALFAGDPQIIETGVEPGYNPSGQTGSQVSMPATLGGGAANGANPVTGSYRASSSKPARLKSPGLAWQYEDEKTKVHYLVLPPEALEALSADATDLRNKIAEGLATVVLDPQNARLTANISGRAVEELRTPQFNRCDQVRDDVEANWLLPVAKLVLRVALKAGIRTRAIDAARADLADFLFDDGAAPRLFVRWANSYMKPDPSDEGVTVTATVSARKEGIITARMALEKVARIFGVNNIDQALDALEKERTERQQRAMAIASAAPATDSDPDEDEGGAPDATENDEAA